MFKKITSAVSIAALAAMSLMSIVSANGEYANFTIANGDPNDAPQASAGKQQQALVVPQVVKLNVGHGDDQDSPAPQGDYSEFTIANGDPSDEGHVPAGKVSARIVFPEVTMLNIGAGDDSNKAVVRSSVKLNIGASDPAEQD